LPHPDGPTRHTNSPSAISKLIPERAAVRPCFVTKVFETCWTVITGRETAIDVPLKAPRPPESLDYSSFFHMMKVTLLTHRLRACELLAIYEFQE
jgi:hypothetical protein